MLIISFPKADSFNHSLLESFNSGKRFLKRKRMDRTEAFFEVKFC